MIKAAIIGMGIGNKHYEAIENYKSTKVKIICEFNEKKIKQLRKKFPKKIITSNENLIFKDKSINLVSIASYDNYHFTQILKCIRHNKNIIIEKPMCLNLNQLKKIYYLTKKNKKIKITSNMVLRANDLFKKIKRKINISDVYYIEGDYIWGRKNKLYGWRSKINDYSVTLGAGIHMIDLINWITKLKPISVYAVGNNKITKNTSFKKNSLVTMIFEYPKDILVKITANCSATFNHMHELRIFTKNQTFINSDNGSYMYTLGKKKTIRGNYPDKKNRKRVIRNLIDMLKNKKIKPIISFKEQIDLMTICFTVDKSINLNKKIKIKYL